MLGRSRCSNLGGAYPNSNFAEGSRTPKAAFSGEIERMSWAQISDRLSRRDQTYRKELLEDKRVKKVSIS